MMPQGNHQGVKKPHSQPITWAYPNSRSINQPNHHHNPPEPNNCIEDPNLPAHACHYMDTENATTTHNVDNLSCSYCPTYDNHLCSSMFCLYPLRRLDRHNHDTLEPQLLDKTAQSINEISKVDEEPNCDCDWWSIINSSSDVSDNSKNVLEEHEESKEQADEDDLSEPDDSDSNSSHPEYCALDDSTGSNTSSSGESESYLAYSTGLNARAIVDADSAEQSESPRSNSTNCESPMCEEAQETGESVPEIARESGNEVQQPRDDGIGSESGADEMSLKQNVNVVINGSTSQDDDSMTVNFRLPLRVKGPTVTNQGNLSTAGPGLGANLVCIEATATVDFTLRRKLPPRPKSWCPDKCTEFWTSETILKKRNLSPVIFNARSTEDADSAQGTPEEVPPKAGQHLVPQFSMTLEEDPKQDESNEDNKSKHLLTVHNSREETDEEDSGVTSDLSRLISEVDTDSESTPVRRSAYKRTQTHSRLLRLISRDLVLAEDGEDLDDFDKATGKDQLDLPQGLGFSDHSNHSSGLTSPDFSPIFEDSWRKFRDSVRRGATDPLMQDSYFRTWKEAKWQDDVAIMSPMVSQNLPAWPYKSKVLCPRVRSTKNVPRAVQGRISKSVIHPGPWGIKYDRC